jgi:hypothetical protein
MLLATTPGSKYMKRYIDVTSCWGVAFTKRQVLSWSAVQQQIRWQANTSSVTLLPDVCCLCWVRQAERTLSYAWLTIVLPLFHAVLLMVQPRKSSLPQQQQHNNS